ncbi:hypothetical protein [Rhodococcus aetherivorans]|uniref:hypothetical protein n=1 Tax=Rhodococcus aetherivorans TaxID=191292 RepID=UPI00045CFBCA|nr:hypothetical protein [Rhodococcus aetherivorans]KDE12439.1 hypothetical protein N505_0115440 [Rhodococcus aetherivorans]
MALNRETAALLEILLDYFDDDAAIAELIAGRSEDREERNVTTPAKRKFRPGTWNDGKAAARRRFGTGADA